MKTKLEERSPLVSGMMGRCGADVGEAFRQGVTNPRQYRECLERCAGCDETEACRMLLEEGDAREGAPDYCLDKEEIEAVKDRLWRAFN